MGEAMGTFAFVSCFAADAVACLPVFFFGAAGAAFVNRSEETEQTRAYRAHMNSDGSPSDTISASYIWMPGTELAAPARIER